MAQNEDSIKSQAKSPNSHLPHVPGPDSSISSFDLLNSYRSAAMFLKSAADCQNPRNKPVNLPPGVVKSRCSSTSEDSVAAAAAAAVASLIPARQHSPSANSKFQAALAMAMAASSSPPSTCPSSSSSIQQGEHAVVAAAAVNNEFRSSDNTQSPSLGAFFRSQHVSSVSYETVDGLPAASGGSVPSDLGFQSSNLPPNPSSNTGGVSTNSLPPFVSSGGQSDIPSASTCLTNAMLLPASIVNVLGQQMQSNQYHQPPSPAYLSTINTNSSGGSFSQQQATQGGPNQGGNEPGPPTLFPQTGGLAQQQPAPHQTHSIPSAASSADTSRYSNPGGRSTSSAALHDDSNNKREQRLLKNREAARECRRKKKEYVRCLERQVSILQDQNRQLIEELQKMKTICAGAFLDPSGQQMALQPPLPDRRNDPGSGGGMDFVDSASAVPPNPHHQQPHPHHRKPPLSTLLSPQPSTDASGGNNSDNFHPSGEMEVDSSSRCNELTLLKSSVSQNQQQQLLLLHGLSAMKDGGVRKNEEGNYSASTSNWISSIPDQKPKFADDEMDTRPTPASPHIHPVKRVLKRFGNEQHQLSQQKAQQEAQQQGCPVGKQDPDKAG